MAPPAAQPDVLHAELEQYGCDQGHAGGKHACLERREQQEQGEKKRRQDVGRCGARHDGAHGQEAEAHAESDEEQSRKHARQNARQAHERGARDSLEPRKRHKQRGRAHAEREQVKRQLGFQETSRSPVGYTGKRKRQRDGDDGYQVGGIEQAFAVMVACEQAHALEAHRHPGDVAAQRCSYGDFCSCWEDPFLD